MFTGYLSLSDSPTIHSLTNHQFSVIAMISDAATLERRVTYTPYGEARHHYNSDVDGDGDVDVNDYNAANTANGKYIYEPSGANGYNVDADFNRDGIINSTDLVLLDATFYKDALPGGLLTSPLHYRCLYRSIANSAI